MDAHRRHNIHRRQKGGGLLDPILGDPTKDTKPTSASSVAPTLKPAASSSAPTPSSSESSTSSAPPSQTSENPEVTTAPPAPVTSFVPGRTQVVTAGGANSTSFLAPSSTNTSPAQTAFLDNKVLSGVVFTFVGIIGFFLIVFAATFFIRRRRNKQLVDEAVAFDPSTIASYEDAEKGRMSSSVGHGSATGNAPEIQKAPIFDQYIPPVPYLPPQGTVPRGQSLYMNPAASLSQSGQAFVAPESWGSPALPQSSQANLVHTNNSRPSSDDGNHRQQQHHTSSRSSSGEIKFAPTVPPDMRRYYDNK
ncbi:hypothetical protein CPB83DRAFT_902123 [Crepidotus variabilis]|uniref:Uncharacterized protein n=1 Tax=Crepidotus variabilis TaxID=179855 RepID=A0A9P6JW48_9AGAR|nr:hypothetical protein CPB83DRAFT_902123 [Crepidotus variabilis]